MTVAIVASLIIFALLAIPTAVIDKRQDREAVDEARHACRVSDEAPAR